MPILVNKRWEAFVLAYYGDANASEAAKIAGYSPKAARAIASRLLTKANIVERLRELQEAAASAKIMSTIERKERLSEIARARMSDFVSVGESGSARFNVTPESLHCGGVASATTRTVVGRDDNPDIDFTTISLHDPVKAIAELNKMENIGRNDAPNVNIQNNSMVIQVVSEQAKAMLADVLAGKGTEATPMLTEGKVFADSNQKP